MLHGGLSASLPRLQSEQTISAEGTGLEMWLSVPVRPLDRRHFMAQLGRDSLAEGASGGDVTGAGDVASRCSRTDVGIGSDRRARGSRR